MLVHLGGNRKVGSGVGVLRLVVIIEAIDGFNLGVVVGLADSADVLRTFSQPFFVRFFLLRRCCGGLAIFIGLLIKDLFRGLTIV